jgi:hypothetical protein
VPTRVVVRPQWRGSRNARRLVPSKVAAGTFTATATIALPKLTAAGSGTHTAPVYTGSAAITLPVVTAAGSGNFATAVYSGTAASALPVMTASGTGTFTAPVYTGSAAIALPALTAAGTGDITNPTWTATAAIGLPALTASGSGTFSEQPPLEEFWFSNPQFAIQDYADAELLGPDGYTWAQGNPLVVDAFGKLVALRQKHNAGIRFAYSNDGGATWDQSGTEINFITRGALAYDSRNDIFHVLWAAVDNADGAIYRRYTVTRDGSNNITAVTAVGGINLQLEANASTSIKQPVLLWLDDADYGTYGALVAVWSAANATDSQLHASMRVLSNDADDNTGANWTQLDGSGTGDPALISSTYNVPATVVSPTAGFLQGASAYRKREGTHAGDLYIACAENLGNVTFRRYEFQGGTDTFDNPTSDITIFDLVTGSGRTEGQEWELLAKWAEDTVNDSVYIAGARWDGATNGETWGVYRVNDDDSVDHLADPYVTGGQFLPADYALTGDIVFDNTSAKLISAHITTSANDMVLTVYDPDGTLDQTFTVFTAADVDIPLLWQDPNSGQVRYTENGPDQLLVIFRDTDGYPSTAPPYRGWFGTVEFSVLMTGDGAVTLPELTAAGAGTFAAPTYTGSAAVTLPDMTAAGAGNFAADIYAGSADIALPELTGAGTATFTAPVYTGTAAITLPDLTASGTGTRTGPTWTATAAVTLPELTASGVGIFAELGLEDITDPAGDWAGDDRRGAWGEELVGAWSGGRRRGRWG